MAEEEQASADRWSRLIEERLAAKVAAGELEVVGVDDAGRPVYRAVPNA